MIRRTLITILLAAAGVAPALAQGNLTLDDAVRRARTQNPTARGAAAAEREAAHRADAARASWLPRVDFSETWQRGDQPVFVFSSLLSQRLFAESNFAIDALNHPSPIDNFRSALLVEQPLFDAGIPAQLAAAQTGREMAAAGRSLVEQALAADVSAAYSRVLVALASLQSAEAALQRADADRRLAGDRRDAGLVTDADVLLLDVHLSRSRERQIRARSDEQVARAQLNRLMGEPLDAVFILDPAAAIPPIPTTDLAALEREAIESRPDLAIAALGEELAETSVRRARAAFLPQVSAQGGWEFNGGAWDTRASSWIVGVSARINLFRGFADRARLAEAREAVERRRNERDDALAAARLDVRVAAAQLEAARASEAVARAAVAQAGESRRIIRDRYEAGLADVATLLRASEGVVDAEAQLVAAQAAVLTGTATLRRALGRQ
jgi:outer membrane protein TolC